MYEEEVTTGEAPYEEEVTTDEAPYEETEGAPLEEWFDEEEATEVDTVCE